MLEQCRTAYIAFKKEPKLSNKLRYFRCLEQLANSGIDFSKDSVYKEV